MATTMPPTAIGLKDKGAIAPGRQADLLVLSDLVNVEVEDVYYKGQLIDKNENIVIKPCAPELKNTVHVAEFSKEAFHLESKDGTFPVILCEEGQITTRKGTLKASDGPCEFQPDDDYQKIAVVERHKATGKIGRGVIGGFGIRGGSYRIQCIPRFPQYYCNRRQ